MQRQHFKKYLAKNINIVLSILFIGPLVLLPTEPDSILHSDILTLNTNKKLTINDLPALKAESWHPKDGGFSDFFKFASTEHWTRVKIPAFSPESQDRNLVVETKFPLYEIVDFYLTEQGKVINHNNQTRGSSKTSGSIGTPYLTYHADQGSNERILYIHSIGYISHVPHFLTRADSVYRNISTSRLVTMVTLMGMAIFILGYNFSMLFTLRNKALLLETIIQLSFTVFSFFFYGYDRTFIPEISANFDLSARVCCAFFLVGLRHGIARIAHEANLHRSSRAIALSYRFIDVVLSIGLVLTVVLPLQWGATYAFVTSILSSTIVIVTHMRFSKLNSIIWFTAANYGAWLCGIIAVGTIFDLTPDSLYTRFSMLIAFIWMGITYAAMSAAKLRLMSRHQDKIERALRSNHSKTELNNLLNQTYNKNEAPVPADVTIMFIDIVGFSTISQYRSPAEIYAALSTKMRAMIAIIERYGGTVDRSIGDGILCFFGRTNETEKNNHAAKCLEAAVEIQKLIIESTIDPANHSETLILPTRIGMHSANVIIGNLGDHFHVDFTMIGSGVNFASRMESACSPFKIMVSQATLDLLGQQGIQTSLFTPVGVAIKHHSGLIKAFEFDPFRDNKSAVRQAELAFLKQIGKERVDNRVITSKSNELKLALDQAHFTVIDFSLHGFKALAPIQLGRKAVIHVQIIAKDHNLNRNLQHYLLQDLVLEVRWSQAQDQDFVHGLKIVGSSSKRREKLFSLLASGTLSIKHDESTDVSSRLDSNVA